MYTYAPASSHRLSRARRLPGPVGPMTVRSQISSRQARAVAPVPSCGARCPPKEAHKTNDTRDWYSTSSTYYYK